MTKRFRWIVIIGVAFFACFWLAGRVPVQAREGTGQLDQILKNQEKILQDLGDIKKELDRIRIRVS